MDSEQVRELGREVKEALDGLAAVIRERDLLLRVLKQAVLTHGGELRVDVSLGAAAKNDPRDLEIGGGGVRLMERL